jgi:hypothetical protein
MQIVQEGDIRVVRMAGHLTSAQVGRPRLFPHIDPKHPGGKILGLFSDLQKWPLVTTGTLAPGGERSIGR